MYTAYSILFACMPEGQKRALDLFKGGCEPLKELQALDNKLSFQPHIIFNLGTHSYKFPLRTVFAIYWSLW